MSRAPIPAQLATAEGIYGVILVSGMIVVSAPHAPGVWDVFVTVVSTVLVFWAAHVYAATVAQHHRISEGPNVGLRKALRSAVSESAGLLVSALTPASILLFGVARVVPDEVAVWAALWVGVGVLAVLGFVAFRSRGFSALACMGGSLGTAAFGVVMIVLKAALH